MNTQTKFRPLALLDTSECAFINCFCACVVHSKSCEPALIELLTNQLKNMENYKVTFIIIFNIQDFDLFSRMEIYNLRFDIKS